MTRIAIAYVLASGGKGWATDIQFFYLKNRLANIP